MNAIATPATLIDLRAAGHPTAPTASATSSTFSLADGVVNFSDLLNSNADSVAISDVTIVEGSSGTKQMTFTVTRAGGTAAFNVNYATSDRREGTPRGCSAS
jgi:hypothetical protein